jgi:hypothetical protein
MVWLRGRASAALDQEGIDAEFIDLCWLRARPGVSR